MLPRIRLRKQRAVFRKARHAAGADPAAEPGVDHRLFFRRERDARDVIQRAAHIFEISLSERELFACASRAHRSSLR